MEFTGQYLTFGEYQSIGGSLTENAFNLLEYKARKKIDKYTSGRLIDLTEQLQEVKMCVNELISIENENNSTIKSENIDGYSYTTMTKDELKKAVYNTIKDYLSECELEDGTPYLYVGTDEVTTLFEDYSL